MLSRRSSTLLGLAFTVGAAMQGGSAAAETYPSRQIRLVVPYVGGTADFVGRTIAEALGPRLGQPVIVENRAGASGTLGSDVVAKAQPDGYTLLIGQTNALAVAPRLLRSIPYDSTRDFAPVSLVANTAQILLVNPRLGVNSVQELIARARSGRSLVYASSGNGDSSHLAAELFKTMTNTTMVHVPYSGSAQASLAVLNGEAQLVFSGIVQGLPHMRSGGLTALGVSTLSRSAAVPEVPTIAEAGVPGYEVSFWSGVVAPAGTPPSIIERLNREIVAVMATPEVARRFSERGLEPVSSTPEAFGELIRSDLTKYADLITRAGLRVD